MSEKPKRGFEGQSVQTGPRPRFEGSLKDRLLGTREGASRGYSGGFSSIKRVLCDIFCSQDETQSED